MKIPQKLIPVYRFVRNKYLLTGLFFLVWLMFFDRYDFFSQYRTVQELNKLNKEKDYYRQEIEKNNVDLNNLLNNSEELERIAREKYLMKADDEEVFIIIDKTKPGWDDQRELKE
jgi:cell division protein FtsB